MRLLDARLPRAAVTVVGVALVAALAVPASGEQQRQPVPRPFPTPGDRGQADAAEVGGALPPGTPAGNASAPPAASLTSQAEAPTAESLGIPIFPNAQYITSYDAGRGQRFHLFGAVTSFQELVSYYGNVLDERGRRVYDRPPIHQFETARFREREMDYRPSVTIKDYAWDGSAGYPNTTPGSDPPAFATIIQFTTLPNSPAATDNR